MGARNHLLLGLLPLHPRQLSLQQPSRPASLPLPDLQPPYQLLLLPDAAPPAAWALQTRHPPAAWTWEPAGHCRLDQSCAWSCQLHSAAGDVSERGTRRRCWREDLALAGLTCGLAPAVACLLSPTVCRAVGRRSCCCGAATSCTQGVVLCLLSPGICDVGRARGWAPVG